MCFFVADESRVLGKYKCIQSCIVCLYFVMLLWLIFLLEYSQFELINKALIKV